MNPYEVMKQRSLIRLVARTYTIAKLLALNTITVSLYNKHSLTNDHVKAYYLFLKAYWSLKNKGKEHKEHTIFRTRQEINDAIVEEARILRKENNRIFLSTRPNDLEPIITKLLLEELILKAPLSRDKNQRPDINDKTCKKKVSYQPNSFILYPAAGTAIVGLMEETKAKKYEEVCEIIPPELVLEILEQLILNQKAEEEHYDTILNSKIIEKRKHTNEELQKIARTSLQFIGIDLKDLFLITTIEEHKSYLEQAKKSFSGDNGKRYVNEINRIKNNDWFNVIKAETQESNGGKEHENTNK